MNRRSFFKTITGVVVGVYAAFVPKEKYISMLEEPIIGIREIKGKLHVFCEHSLWEVIEKDVGKLRWRAKI